MSYQPFRVVLDEDAIIIEFEDPQNLLGYGVNGEAVLGQNWFSLFIETVDFKSVMTVFTGLFDGENPLAWQAFKNDVITADKRHVLMDFYNQLIETQNQRRLQSFGFEHHTGEIKNFSATDHL